jgi:ArsR family metal-binding transcriptional regulator
MKTFYISHGSNILIDPETKQCDRVSSERQAIDSIYLAKEPMHVVYGYGEQHRELDVDAGDIIITFYSEDFNTRMLVVNSKEWAENIENYNKKMQEEKERWAQKDQNKKCTDCECPCGSSIG